MKWPNQPRHAQPVWWSVQHTVLWEEHGPVLRDAFERRRAAADRARLTRQGPDDAVFQDPATTTRATTPRNVDVDHAYAVPDNNWEVGTAWEQIEPAVRYGVGARAQYPQHDGWTEELEARLRQDWSEGNDPSAWEKVKHAIRHGFESVRKKKH
jgi:hypothetical protein